MIVSNDLVLFLMNAMLCYSHITNFYWLRMSATNMFGFCIFLSRGNIPGLPRIILIINNELIYWISLVKRCLAVLKDFVVNSHNAYTNIDVVYVKIIRVSVILGSAGEASIPNTWLSTIIAAFIIFIFISWSLFKPFVRWLVLLIWFLVIWSLYGLLRSGSRYDWLRFCRCEGAWSQRSSWRTTCSIKIEWVTASIDILSVPVLKRIKLWFFELLSRAGYRQVFF